MRNSKAELEKCLNERILVLDGAMGTMLQQKNLHAGDFGGSVFEGCNEYLVKTRPEIILDIHRRYLTAGSDIIETDTFGGTELVLAEYRLENQAAELNRIAAQLARRSADEFSTPAKPRFVAGAMGPTTKAITVTGGVAFEELRGYFYRQARALMEGGSDLLLVETCQDTRNVKAALLAIRQLGRELGFIVPTMLSITIEPTGTMLAGQSIDALWVSIENFDLLSVGLNCATGPEFMTDHLRTLHQLSHSRISCYPNAGLPDEEGNYRETPESLAHELERFVDHGWINLIGGCCGTTDAHIQAIAQMVKAKQPRTVPPASLKVFYSGIELVEAEESNRPLLVGERTNVIGSRIFKNLIMEEKWEESTEIARRQARHGAQIIDVCLQSADRDELKDIPLFYDRLIRKIKNPIMIDTTDPRAVELALTYCQGKSIINSINLEDGEEKFERICPLARDYGAALVVGCIDEDPVQAQAFTRERKLAIARRSFDLLTGKYHIPPENIIFDPLVFPCATGDENYIGGAVETIEGVRWIKRHFPQCKTILGISNVSFGLPMAAREVVNSVFLYHCTRAGLDLAIVNAEKLQRFASLPEVERLLAENLLFNHSPELSAADGATAILPRGASSDWREQSRAQKAGINQSNIASISEHFRANTRKEVEKGVQLPLDERLARCIVEGSQDGLIEDLNLKLQEGSSALEIVNGPLMKGMNEVGRLFNDNQLIVAEVLQSAEAMKAAVRHLEGFMEKNESACKGRVILATVKGDVHDIGKNLVEIILSNNGYEVVNLGIKVPPEALIAAWREHHPDAIGLSGLLVKSAQQMVTTAGDLSAAGIQVPLLVGGAALSEKFTRHKITPAYGNAVCYAKDAMTGLRLMNQLADSATREETLRQNGPAPMEPASVGEILPVRISSTQRSRRVRADLPIPQAPYLERKIREIPDLHQIWSYVNPFMLYGRHLGFKGNIEKMLGQHDPKALELHSLVEDIKKEASQFMRVRAVWQFLEAEAEGNAIHLFAAGSGSPVHTFKFERQDRSDGLCLSDYLLPPSQGQRDHLVLMVVTAGEGIRERSEKAKTEGQYVRSHGLQALAIETAEACAEWLHRRIREDWGFPDAPGMTMQQRFTSKYRGKRYSFGYGACPNLDYQAGIWKLLRPEDIGVQLTEGMMMDPEASVSALVFHHPDCAYFSVSPETGIE